MWLGSCERPWELSSLVPEPSEGGGVGKGHPSPGRPRKLAGLDRELPSRKGAGRKHPDQSSFGVESQGTIAPTERRSGERAKPEGKIVIPGSGPPTREVVA
ncbi:hypothetical protein AKJ45_03700 [candidate division MSBL1 archaeon SCGC-AAA261F19]|uniref:Uncharacterized protein n=1 Tax=candidate division MSBL1 archaeon SCGC-AAA261F19 TaxID=1698275 RepID=A0A133V6P7_9EURY|nr:hypothetical protein AKJ45_03700 [candidate division MSBL1 archaeon SCGC-AAA261F19]